MDSAAGELKRGQVGSGGEEGGKRGNMGRDN